MVTTYTSPFDPDIEIIHSTWEDNTFLDTAYVKVLQDLMVQDDNFYRVYTLGLWGLVQRRIFTNYQIIPELPTMDTARWGYGLDFGLVNPTAIIKVCLYKDKFYVEERLYKSGLTNSDIIAFFSHEERGDIWGDPTSKMMIAEINRAGYAAVEGHKGVKEGIDLCQRQTLFIPQSSVNLIKEIQSYQWKADKDGNVLPEPIKFNDHALDAMRYAIYGLTERYGFATQRPHSLEPIKSLSFENVRDRVLGRWLKIEGR